MTLRILGRLAALALPFAVTVAPLAAQQYPPAAPAAPAGPLPPAATAPARPLPPSGQYGDKWYERPEAVREVIERAKATGYSYATTLDAQTHALARAYAPAADGLTFTTRGQPWYQGDAADSAYRAAYALFSRQEYRSAADRFAEVRAKYPTTRYFCSAAYYEGFARYRLGTTNDLRTAYRVLDGMAAQGRCADASRSQDVPELLARVDGVLARMGDGDASERVRRAASQGRRVCDREERNVKIQALSALSQMDPEGAKAILARVLDQRDECSAPVRREALGLVARTADAASITTLARVARTDPDYETQAAAVEALTRIASDPAYAAIEDLLRTSTEERVQAAAARAMSRSDSPRAQATIRALAERRDVSERLRISVINSLGQQGMSGAGAPVSTDFWKALYGKVESDDLRRAIVNAVNRNSDDGMAFLLSVARSGNEATSVREQAIARVRQSAPVADLYRLFEAADSRSVRQSIVAGLGARKEPEATDRLIDIAKRGTDPEVRASAIRYLGQPARRDDPKVREALADILGART